MPWRFGFVLRVPFPMRCGIFVSISDRWRLQSKTWFCDHNYSSIWNLYYIELTIIFPSVYFDRGGSFKFPFSEIAHSFSAEIRKRFPNYRIPKIVNSAMANFRYMYLRPLYGVKIRHTPIYCGRQHHETLYIVCRILHRNTPVSPYFQKP